MKRTMRLITALSALFVVAIGVAACGSSGIPNSDVAEVAGNGISTQAFDHWMYVAEKGNAVESGAAVIVPTDPPKFTGCIAQIRTQIASLAKSSDTTLQSDCKELFTNLSAEVMDFLVKAYWYQAIAYQDKITLTSAELSKAFAAAQKEEFPTTAEYTAFLAESGETRQDINFRLRVNTVFQKLLAKDVAKITPAQIRSYYLSHASSFSTPETRSVKIIETAGTSAGKSAIAAAESAVKSGQSWASVAKKYSINTATKTTGGVVADLQAGQEEAAVSKVIFAAPLNQLKGPIKGTFGYYLIEVTKITPGTSTPLAKATKSIKAAITQAAETAAQTKINAKAKKEYQARTKCRALYSMADCAGYTAPVTTTTAAAATPTTAASSGAADTGSQTSTVSATTAASTTTTK